MFSGIKDRLAGKKILITGASSGIGKQTAVSFAEITQGDVSLILTARREEKLMQLKQDLESQYEKITVHVVAIDVSDYKSIDEKLTTIPDSLKSIDILINNAGLALGRDHVSDLNLQDAYNMINTNVTGLITLTHFFVPLMKKQDSGIIMNIGSIAGRNPYPGGSVYCSTKAAVKFFTRSLRKELTDTKIKVMEIAPGETKTDFSLVRYKGDEDKATSIYEGKAPLLATDIAELIVFACSRSDPTVLAEILVLPTYQA